MTNLPAFPVIQKELNRKPQEFVLRLRNEFSDFVQASTITPDELADLAMHYMRKCDHEIERYRKKHQNEMHGAYTLYTDQLHDVVKLFIEQGMNKNYVDDSGKALCDLAMEIGEEAGKRVLPLIYTDPKTLGSLDWIDRQLHFLRNLLEMHAKDLKETYNSLPETVKATAFGQKLDELNRVDIWKMKDQIDDMLRIFRMIR